MFVCAFAGTIPNSVPVHQRERPEFSRLDKLKNYIDIMKKMMCIITLFVASFTASAQLIKNDTTNEKGRIIDCYPWVVEQEDGDYLMSYRYVKSGESEGYLLELICGRQKPWRVSTDAGCILKFSDGSFTTVSALMPSVIEQGANIVTYYIAPDAIGEHLKGLTDIMMRTSYQGQTYPVKIRMTDEARAHMMDACLQLMVATGR
jgi:hypothetical protein